MLQVVRRASLLLAVVLLAGCQTIDFKGLVAPTGDVVDSRFEQSMQLNAGMPKTTIEAAESYLFYVSADPHIDATFGNLREFATRLRNDSQARFGVVLGDCTDRRNVLANYVEAIAYVEGEQVFDYPIFSVIGNHDLFFSGWDEFCKMLGASVYWFDVECGGGRDLFLVLDSASGTMGRLQIDWLQAFLSAERSKYRHCVVLTHTNLFYTDNSQTGSGNLAIEETALLTEMFSRHRVALCLQGHDHYREDLSFGGVRYTIVGTIRDEAEKPEFLVVEMSDKGVEYRWVYLQK